VAEVCGRNALIVSGSRKIKNLMERGKNK